MLFTESGNRVFNAIQSNGESRRVEYTIDDKGKAVIVSVDSVSVTEAPLPPQFAFVVQGWIEEHRASLHSHADFFGSLSIGASLFGLARNQQPIPHELFTA